MKNIIIKQTLFAFFLMSALVLEAQVLNMDNETIIHDGKERSAIKVEIAPNSKDVKKSFKDYMDDRYNIDVEGIGFLKNKEVVYTNTAVIPSIATEPVQIFMKVRGKGNKTTIYVFGQTNNNNQITRFSDYTAYDGMKDLTTDFLNTLLPNYYQDIVENQQDEVKDLEDDRDDMQKKLAKNRNKIEELKQENEELERKIASVKVKLEQGVEKLGEKKQTLRQVNTKLDGMNNKK